MIELPNYSKSFDYENNFYLSCNVQRISKMIAHYELFKKTLNLTGDIVECGVFKGVSLIRFASFRDMFGASNGKKIIGFDVFGKFPESKSTQDKEFREKFVNDAGDESIDDTQLLSVLLNKGIGDNVELVKGDVCSTIPQYVEKHNELRICLLNLDTDTYEPAVVVLENLWDRIVRGGVLISDEYGVSSGENKAVDDFFKDKDVVIRKFPFCKTVSYIVKM